MEVHLCFFTTIRRCAMTRRATATPLGVAGALVRPLTQISARCWLSCGTNLKPALRIGKPWIRAKHFGLPTRKHLLRFSTTLGRRIGGAGGLPGMRADADSRSSSELERDILYSALRLGCGRIRARVKMARAPTECTARDPGPSR